MKNQPWVGVFLVLLGAALLLRNFGILPDFLYHIFRWPNFLFLIAIGLLVTGKAKGAVVLVAIASCFWVLRWFGPEIVWPMILIGIGVAIFLRQSGRLEWLSTDHGNAPNEGINETVIFSGSNRNYAHQEFKGGRITTIFGGTEIDLHDANLNEDAVLDIFCMFGGVEISAPSHWKIDLKVNPAFGGVSDERKKADPVGSTLIIKGNVLFGGIEIKS